MQYRPSSFRHDIAAAASGDPDQPAPEGRAVAYALDALPALRPSETPLTTSPVDAPGLLTLIVNATLRSGLKTFAALEDRAAAATELQKLTEKRVRGVVDATGYFVPSFAEPKVSRVEGMPIALGRDADAPVSRTFASALNTSARIDMSFAGNAADNRIAKLLSARVSDDEGETRTLLERLVADDPFARALRALGLAPSVAEAAADRFREKRQAGLKTVTAIDGDRMKAVFVPDGEGGYLQVTPVPSVALYTEIPQRIRDRRVAESAWTPVSRRTTSAKPQNVGLQANYQGGRITRIHGRYQPIRALGYAGKLTAVQYGAPFFTTGMVEKTDAERFAALALTILGAGGDGYVNADIREGRDRRIDRMVTQLVEEVRAFQDYCAGHLDELAQPGVFNRSDYVRDIFALNERPAGRDEIDQIVDAITRAILQAAVRRHENFSRADAADDRVRAPIEAVARTRVEQEFG